MMGRIYALLKRDKKKLVEMREKQIKWCMTMADLACSWCQFGSHIIMEDVLLIKQNDTHMLIFLVDLLKTSFRFMFSVSFFFDETLPNFPFLLIYSKLICIINVIIFGLDFAEGFCHTLCLVSVYSAFRSEKKASWKSWCYCALDHQRCTYLRLRVSLLTTFHNELGLVKSSCPLTSLVNLIPLESFI
jgi:hypothetical protein